MERAGSAEAGREKAFSMIMTVSPEDLAEKRS
jgi:hypothetical protein